LIIEKISKSKKNNFFTFSINKLNGSLKLKKNKLYLAEVFDKKRKNPNLLILKKL
jgi:hypothetical protein